MRRISWTPPTTPFTLDHVSPLGVTPDMLEWAARTGRVTRLTHGVYIATESVPQDASQQHLLLATAHQLRNPKLIASHETAALAWGLDLADPHAAEGIPAFIAPAGSGIRSSTGPLFRIHARRLPTQHRTSHPVGLRLTSPERTAVDVAACLPLPEALVILDAAARAQMRAVAGERGLRRAYADPRRIVESVVPLSAAAEHAATRVTRAAITQLLALTDPRRESAAESLSFGHFHLSGLPVPELQAPVDSPDGEIYPDFLWRRWMVVGEVDGAVKYNQPEALVAEKRRQERLEQRGLLVVRWMAEEILYRPATVIARVAHALEMRA